MNKNSLNKISTLGVLFVIGSIASLSNILSGAFADDNMAGYGYNCAGSYGYGYFCVDSKSKLSGPVTTESNAFEVENDDRVSKDGFSSLDSSSSNSDNSESTGTKTNDSDSKTLSPELEKLKKVLDINDDELENLLETLKNDDSEGKQETKNLVRYYLQRKADKGDSKDEDVNSILDDLFGDDAEDISIDTGDLDNLSNDGNADINMYPDMLPQTGVEA